MQILLVFVILEDISIIAPNKATVFFEQKRIFAFLFIFFLRQNLDLLLPANLKVGRLMLFHAFK